LRSLAPGGRPILGDGSTAFGGPDCSCAMSCWERCSLLALYAMVAAVVAMAMAAIELSSDSVV
jgi:hypothetical protein